MENQSNAQWKAIQVVEKILQKLEDLEYTTDNDNNNIDNIIYNILMEAYSPEYGKTLMEVFEEEEEAMIKEQEKTFDDYFNDYYKNPASLNDVIDDYFCCEKHNPQHEIT